MKFNYSISGDEFFVKSYDNERSSSHLKDSIEQESIYEVDIPHREIGQHHVPFNLNSPPHSPLAESTPGLYKYRLDIL